MIEMKDWVPVRLYMHVPLRAAQRVLPDGVTEGVVAFACAIT
jgi:hypothetical protein